MRLWPLASGVLAAALSGGPRPAHAGRGADRRAPVQYQVALPAPHTQYVEITMVVPGAPGRNVDVAMPAWTPGSYLIRDFARHVYDVRAEDLRGRPIAVKRLDKQSWRVEHRRRGFRLRYRVFADERSVRTSHVDDRHATLLGTSVFLYLVGRTDRPATVDIAAPAGWKAYSALPQAVAKSGRVRLTAPDYDTLVDSPIELGTPAHHEFRAGGARFEYVLSDAHDTPVDPKRLVTDAQRVVRTFGRMMGGFPFKRYVFLMYANQNGGGGLEHGSSTSMMMSRSALSRADAYDRAAHMTAHEFFHLWNVKRIHDKVLGPFDYARETHSRLLWFHEGLTETIEEQAMVRAGIVQPTAYLDRLASSWTRYCDKPGRNAAPISQTSFEAWVKQYQRASNHPNVTVSYYEKGALIGVALDLEIRLRAASHGGSGTLVGVFRRLMASHGKAGKGISDRDIVAAVSAEAGDDMAWFFGRYVDGVRELPLPALLGKIGVRVRRHRPWTTPDGKPLADAAQVARLRVDAGIELSGRVIRNVRPGSPGWDAGLMRGDELLAIDGRKVRSETHAKDLMAKKGPGQAVRVALFRGGRLRQISVKLRENPKWVFVFDLAAKPGATKRRLRDAWLRVYDEAELQRF